MLRGAAALRGVVTATDGKQIVASDLSNIEGRVLAWLAGEEWKLQAFRDYDAGHGADLYNLTAVSILGGDPFKVSKSVRNAFGKVPELALGFGGGPSGLQTFAKAYGVSFAEHMGTIQQSVSRDTVDYATRAYNERGRDSGLDALEWVASEVVKLAWRAKNQKIKALWDLCGHAARAAILQPGKWFAAGAKLAYCGARRKDSVWLMCRLPSGRYLTYFDAKVVGDHITYMGFGDEDGTGGAKVWTRLRTYPGKLVANATQSTARDVLADSMLVAEAAGYEIVLSVHDELVTQSEHSSVGLSEIMSAGHDWTEGLPLAAAGFEATRYKKGD
jgi:DNA polymerase